MVRTLEQILVVEKPEIVKNAQEKAEEMLLKIHFFSIRCNSIPKIVASAAQNDLNPSVYLVIFLTFLRK